MSRVSHPSHVVVVLSCEYKRVAEQLLLTCLRRKKESWGMSLVLHVQPVNKRFLLTTILALQGDQTTILGT